MNGINPKNTPLYVLIIFASPKYPNNNINQFSPNM